MLGLSQNLGNAGKSGHAGAFAELREGREDLW